MCEIFLMTTLLSIILIEISSFSNSVSTNTYQLVKMVFQFDLLSLC